jgi:hypothetical protein
VSVQDQPGWTALAADGVHVLVGWEAQAPGLERVRAATAGGLDAVLDALTVDGIRRAPDFVAVEQGAPLRLVARGSAYAVVSGPGVEEEFRSAGRGPWADDDAPHGTTAVDLRPGVAEVQEPAPGPTPDPAPGLAPGLAPDPTPAPEPAGPPSAQPAGRGGWRLPSRLGRRGQPEPEPAPVASAGVDEVEDLPSYDHLFGATQHGRPEAGAARYLGAHDTDSLSEPGIGRAPIEAAGGFTPAHPESAQTLPPPTDTDRATPERAAQPPRAVGPRPPAPEGPAPAPAATPAPPAGGLIDSVPWRSGGSNVAPPEEPLPPPAPARPRASGGVQTPPPAPTLRPTGAVPPAPVATSTPPAQSIPQPVPAPTAAPSPQPPAPPVAAQPTTVQPATPQPATPQPTTPQPTTPQPTTPQPTTVQPPVAPPAPTAAEVDDDAEATVDRSALLAAAQPESGPLVLAVLCPAGHPSPPHAASCRTCGREIPPQQPFQTPRPPLGVLRLASGDVVSLDRGVLLGRSPKVNADLPVADRPHLVRVTSPENDISRNHVEVVLDGWHVLVRDLGSTNGTTVALPGQVPVRLRPGDQQVIEPGTIVTLADEVSVTFEVGA